MKALVEGWMACYSSSLLIQSMHCVNLHMEYTFCRVCLTKHLIVLLIEKCNRWCRFYLPKTLSVKWLHVDVNLSLLSLQT